MSRQVVRDPALTAADCLDRSRQRLSAKQQRGEIRLPYRDVDELVGGLSAGQVVVVAADREVGRTTFALDLCRSASMAQECATVLVSPMLDAAEVGLRLLSAESRVSRHSLWSGRVREIDQPRVAAAEKRIQSADLRFLSTTLSTADVGTKLLETAMRRPVELIVVDDMDLLDPAGTGRTALQQVRLWAAMFQVPVVVTAALVRPRPMVIDEAHDVSLEQVWPGEPSEHPDLSIVIQRPDLFDGSSRPGEADFYVRRVLGDISRVGVGWQGHFGRFTDSPRTGTGRDTN